MFNFGNIKIKRKRRYKEGGENGMRDWGEQNSLYDTYCNNTEIKEKKNRIKSVMKKEIYDALVASPVNILKI